MSVAVMLSPYRSPVQVELVQGNSDAVSSIPLTFHYYSLFEQRNDSYIVYDGADGYAPKRTSAFAKNMLCESYNVFQGWPSWSAGVMWVLKLQQDLHVKGNVELTAYLSSTFDGFGWFDGGGYSMGLADLDEQGNDVTAFPAEGAGGLGNPFDETPRPYVLNVAVDYVFKKGHYIGFWVGAGATIQGFTYTIYFDSSDAPSGVILPIEDQTKTYSFDATVEETTYEIDMVSDSYLSNFGFDQLEKQISFSASGIPGTAGYCDVWIPKTLFGGSFEVLLDDQPVTSTKAENETHSCIDFTFTNDVDNIKIIAELITIQQLDHITIWPETMNIQIGSLQQFSAQGYDQNSNPIADLTFSWSVTGGIGSANPTSGLTTTFTASTLGSGSIVASSAYMGTTKSGSASITVTTEPTVTPEPTATPGPTVTPNIGGPKIVHTPINVANSGQTIPITAVITDNNRVAEAKLCFRKANEITYTTASMTPSSGNKYSGNIPASIVTVAGVQYYIGASDGTQSSTHPATNPETNPHNIMVIDRDVAPSEAILSDPSEMTHNSIKISWIQSTEADFASYDIYQSTSHGTLGTKILTITDRLVSSYIVTDLLANTTYYFTIRVVDNAGLFTDSNQVAGTTAQSVEDGSTLTWILGITGGIGVASALIIVLLLFNRRKK